MRRQEARPGYNNNVTAYIEKHNIKTKQFYNKKEENKKFLIKTASQAPTKDFNQPKQFTTTSTTSTSRTTTKQSYLQTPSPTPSPLAVQLTRAPQHQNILAKPGRYEDYDDYVPLYQLDEQYQYDPFSDYEEYDEENTFYHF